MQKIRSTIFVIWMYSTMFIIGVCALPVLLFPYQYALYIFRFWLRLVMGGAEILCGLKLKIEGLENIPKTEFFIASKHHSMVDVLIPWLIFNRLAIILKKELSYLPVFGWYAVKLKNIVIDRSAGMRSLKNMLHLAKQRTKEGRSILIFPEGTRVAPGENKGYKPGVYALYQGLGACCLPIAHNAGLYWPRKGITKKSGQIIVRILPPILPYLSRKEFMRTLEQEIETHSLALLPDTKNIEKNHIIEN